MGQEFANSFFVHSIHFNKVKARVIHFITYSGCAQNYVYRSKPYILKKLKKMRIFFVSKQREEKNKVIRSMQKVVDYDDNGDARDVQVFNRISV